MTSDTVFEGFLNDEQPRQVEQAHRKSSPEVVSVPVHFFSSEQPKMKSSISRQSAAVNIQRIFRGFLVRKSVKKILSIKSEVSEVEKRINDLITRDAKERLRVNETLMSFLFKLDSIPGVDVGVRDFRKAVIKKAIALQERIDSISAAKNESAVIDCEIDDEVVDDTADWDSGMKVDGEDDAINEDVKDIDENCNSDEVVDECSVDESETEGFVVVSKEETREGTTDDNKRNTHLLEKLVDDNEKMMALMMQMFERNENQTRILNSLSQRVENLEKSFL